MPYYGLFIPSKNGPATTTNSANSVDQTNSNYVFDKKCKALEILKYNKDGRMREFLNEDDAIKYAQTGYEEPVTPRYADPKGASTAAVEKAAFRAPSKQELIEFRKIIEAGDFERVKAIIWDNPRYLVSSGDTPTTLKEGYRYNALHVCAISKKTRIAELILQTVSNPKFVDLLTGKKNDEKMCKELCKNLLDYYLNIPEKGRSETPLHFAAKVGSVEMVELLTSYPECKMTANNEGRTPKEIICLRQPGAAPEVYKKIETLLEERFYVPVLRSVDNAIPPEIGEPFQINNPPNLNSDPLCPEVKILALAGPMPMEQAKQFRRRWKTPPRTGGSGSSPIANNPFISPRSNNLNVTPTKNLNGFDTRSNVTLQRRALFNASPRFSPSTLEREHKYLNESDVHLDSQNGNGDYNSKEIKIVTESSISVETVVEPNNNNNSHDETDDSRCQSNQNHYGLICPPTILRIQKSSFFTYREPSALCASPTAFEDSNVGLLNDSFLTVPREQFDLPGFKERHVKISDHEKGLELIGRELAREQKVEWREYWDFLDEYIDISSIDGLLKLENHFAQRVKMESAAVAAAANSKKTVKTMATATVALDDVCSALEKLGFTRDDTAHNSTAFRNVLGSMESGNNRSDFNAHAPSSSSSTTTTPYTCVEKSLQVLAKRMTKTIIHNIENVVKINDTLLSELKRLKSLICSFKEDARFLDIHFSKVHSRIGNLVSIYLQNSQEVTLATKAKILVVIKNLQTTSGERREHIECVCSKIFENLINQESPSTLPENLKTEELCSKAWLSEQECECQWDSNLSRKTSRRKHMEARFKSHQNAAQPQKTQMGDARGEEWRCALSGNESSEEDFRSMSESESDIEEIWYTPSSSPIEIEKDSSDRNSDYKIFVLGNEPTKRDLDVLNAIFHVEIDPKKYTNIYNWKTALLQFPNEEMDYFPSPAIVKKTHTFTSTRKLFNTPIKEEQSPYNNSMQPNTLTENESPQHQYQQKPKPIVPIAKRLFGTPGRSKIYGNLLGNDNGGPPRTPLNKLRGLFSSYRENIEDSPLPGSSPASSFIAGSNNDDSNNLSLFNISTAE